MGELFGTELRRLREAAGLSRSELSRRTVRENDVGISESTIEALETIPDRKPDDRTVERLGFVLDAAGEKLRSYPFALAKMELDPWVVGFDAAERALLAFRRGLGDVAPDHLAAALTAAYERENVPAQPADSPDPDGQAKRRRGARGR